MSHIFSRPIIKLTSVHHVLMTHTASLHICLIFFSFLLYAVYSITDIQKLPLLHISQQLIILLAYIQGQIETNLWNRLIICVFSLVRQIRGQLESERNKSIQESEEDDDRDVNEPASACLLDSTLDAGTWVKAAEFVPGQLWQSVGK